MAPKFDFTPIDLEEWQKEWELLEANFKLQRELIEELEQLENESSSSSSSSSESSSSSSSSESSEEISISLEGERRDVREMGSEAALPKWASEPCIMGIDEAGRGPVLGPMVYGCLYCACSYQKTLATLEFADSKTLKEEKREELFENLKADESLGWAADIIDPRELSSKMLRKDKVNLNEISHNSAIGLITRALNMGVLLTEVYLDTVGDPEKYRQKLSNIFPSIKVVVAKKADSLYPVVSGASIVAKVTRDRALREWVLEETAENIDRNFGSGYPGDPETKSWLKNHKHSVFGFPSLVRFSWGTCTSYLKETTEVSWESDEVEEDGSKGGSSKRQVKLSSLGFTSSKRKSEEIESSAKGRCKFFQSRKLEQLSQF